MPCVAEEVELDLVFDISSGYYPGLFVNDAEDCEKRRGSCSHPLVGWATLSIAVG